MPDFTIWGILWFIAAGVLGLIMWGARVSPNEAASRLSEWAAMFGIHDPPAWLRARAADRWVRRGAFFALCILLFVGGMRFDNWLYSPRLSTTAPKVVGDITKYQWPPLTEEETLSIRLALKSFQKHTSFRIICTDKDCKDLASSFVMLFHGIGWTVFADYNADFNTPVGISLYQKDVTDHQLADVIEKATNGRLKIDVRPYNDPRYESLFIGIKP